MLCCIRGAKTLNDVFTDSVVSEGIDKEIEMKVHSGVKWRAEFYINKIEDKLKVCAEYIIITGYSLGNSIAYYLYLLYVKRHLEDWGQKNKASRFKVVLFASPALATKSEKENILNFNNMLIDINMVEIICHLLFVKLKFSILFYFKQNIFFIRARHRWRGL